jgi:hypothetical protein
MPSRIRGLSAVLVLLLSSLPSAHSQEEVPFNAIDESSPSSPESCAVQEFEKTHAEMLSKGPRVSLNPAMGPTNAFFPAGWTGGIDDIDGGRAWALRHTLTNQDTIAHTQKVYRELHAQHNPPPPPEVPPTPPPWRWVPAPPPGYQPEDDSAP